MEPANDSKAGQPNSYTFSKEERLCSKHLIALLFSKGSSFNLYPLRFVYYSPGEELQGPTQLLVSVPKRAFKRATDRNRLKRQIREAYRLNKHLIVQSPEQAPRLLGILYIGKEKKSFDAIQKKLISGLVRCLSK
ncbi:ribonuclease P protein component [Pontibacter silvestris]|uniref:Ribonuclease P protein component n=1 Tax=Pontibacter silvestris TaxID=2305183 RepID=A0ABW4WUW1_9BACT|nr:ribonuclease P protein component [Pontibacter silvestris]MCC9136499.1 ribonuclease P protein component [Pontibacter silvestris]